MSIRDSYNAIHYRGRTIRLAYIARLEALARLHSLTPAPVSRARVLEVACGDGTNLISAACAFPESQFLGVDLAEGPLDQGRQAIRDLGLSNIELRAADLLELPPESIGSMDYIIAHGLYSWVPPPVQHGLLVLAGKCLAAGGVAYISYNALPGGRIRQMLRDMLMYHTRFIDSPEEKIHQARQMLAFLQHHSSEQLSGFNLKKELDVLLARDAWGLFHDELSENNEQILFRDFMDRAAAQGLQFLGEADLAASNFPGLPPLPDRVEREQYIDFVRQRRFRQTVLCRADAEITDDPKSAGLAGLYIAADVAVPADLQPEAAREARFEFGKRGGITTNNPVIQTVMARLGRAFPQALAFDELQREVDSLGIRAEPPLADFLLQLLRSQVAHVYSAPFGLSAGVSAHPRLYSLARWQLDHNPDVETITHNTVELKSEAEQQFCRLLDGTHAHAELAQTAGITEEEIAGRLRDLWRLGLLEA